MEPSLVLTTVMPGPLETGHLVVRIDHMAPNQANHPRTLWVGSSYDNADAAEDVIRRDTSYDAPVEGPNSSMPSS